MDKEPELVRCPNCGRYTVHPADNYSLEQCSNCGWLAPIPPWRLPGVIRLPRPTNPWDDRKDKDKDG